jgi:hypothetical protein
VNAFLYSDVLDSAGEGSFRVLARISMLSREDGGAAGPRGPKYRPNHNFGAAENRTFYIGQVEIPDDTVLCPGETRDLIVDFFNVRGIADLAKVGAKWRIQEGPNLVANAEVLQLILQA